MKLEPECIGCIFNQILNAFKLINHSVDRDLIIQTQKKVMEYLLNQDLDDITAPIVGRYVYNMIGEMMGVKDPYENLKNKYNQLALEHYDEIKKFVLQQDDPVFEAIIVSALGNTIDFASQHDIDLINDLKNFSLNDLKINDYDKFKNSLEKKKELLILGDNAGEIVFDKLLIEILLKIYSNLEIIYTVRKAPIINDATMKEAKEISLTSLVKVIESSGAPGIDLNDVTEEFKKYFFSEDYVILSKGQGNFESLNEKLIPNDDFYYLLKAKCILMERMFNVDAGSLVFKKREN